MTQRIHIILVLVTEAMVRSGGVGSLCALPAAPGGVDADVWGKKHNFVVFFDVFERVLGGS